MKSYLEGQRGLACRILMGRTGLIISWLAGFLPTLVVEFKFWGFRVSFCVKGLKGQGPRGKAEDSCVAYRA